MSTQGTTSLAALPVPTQDGAVSLQASEKNVVVANMAAELAAKREQADVGQPTGGVIVGQPQPQPQPQASGMGGPGGPAIPTPSAASGLPPQTAGAPPHAMPSPAQQAAYARGVAGAAASGALALPARDVVGSTGEVALDPQSRPLHTPQVAPQGADYIADIERAQQAKAHAAQQRRAAAAAGEAHAVDVISDPAVQAAAIAGALFLVAQLPATRSLLTKALPKLYTQAAGGGPTTGGAAALAVAFAAAFYGASVAATYLGS